MMCFLDHWHFLWLRSEGIVATINVMMVIGTFNVIAAVIGIAKVNATTIKA